MTSQIVAIIYPLSVFVVLAFGLAAALVSWKLVRSNKLANTLEYFLTARNSMGVFFIGWSFYAAFVGSWIAFATPSLVGGYAVPSGMQGNVANAFTSGLPIILVALLSLFIRRTYPRVLSFSDFLKARFGLVVTTYVVAVMLVQMGVSMLAEFIQIGMLFQTVLGSTRWPIVLIIALVTTCYTAFGGLHVSIVTDQFQAILSFILLIILCIYMGVTFDAPLPPMDDKIAGNTTVGRSAWGVYFFMNFMYVVYSEQFWQRCWASQNSRTLIAGSIMGAILIFVITFCFGLFGLLARWGGLADVKDPPFDTQGYDYSGTLVLFTNFLTDDGELITWIVLCVSLICVSLSSSAIDTLENALVTCISGFVLTRVHLMYIRSLVALLTAVPLIISLINPDIPVNDVYLFGTLVSITSAVPVLLGLIPGRFCGRTITPFVVITSTLISYTALFVYARIDRLNDCYYAYFPSCDTYRIALKDLFIKAYTWDPFIVALVAGTLGTVGAVGVEMGFRAVASRLTGGRVGRWPTVPPVCMGQHEPPEEATKPHSEVGKGKQVDAAKAGGKAGGGTGGGAGAGA